MTLAPSNDLEAFLKAACDLGHVVSVSPRRGSLEELFVRRARQEAV